MVAKLLLATFVTSFLTVSANDVLVAPTPVPTTPFSRLEFCRTAGAGTVAFFDKSTKEVNDRGDFLMWSNAGAQIQLRRTAPVEGADDGKAYTTGVVIQGQYFCGWKFEITMVAGPEFVMWTSDPQKVETKFTGQTAIAAALKDWIENSGCVGDVTRLGFSGPASGNLAFEFNVIRPKDAEGRMFVNVQMAKGTADIKPDIRVLTGVVGVLLDDDLARGICLQPEDERYYQLECNSSTFTKAGCINTDSNCFSVGLHHYRYLDNTMVTKQDRGDFTLWSVNGLTVQQRIGASRLIPDTVPQFDTLSMAVAAALEGEFLCGIKMELYVDRDEKYSMIVTKPGVAAKTFLGLTEIGTGFQEIGNGCAKAHAITHGNTFALDFEGGAAFRAQFLAHGLQLFVFRVKKALLAVDSGVCTNDANSFNTLGCNDVLFSRKAPECTEKLACLSMGGHHLVLFNGWRRDFQDRGDYTVWKTNGLNIQERHGNAPPVPTNDNISFSSAVMFEGAALCGAKFEIYRTTETMVVGTEKLIVTQAGQVKSFVGLTAIFDFLKTWADSCAKVEVTVVTNAVAFKIAGIGGYRVQITPLGMNQWIFNLADSLPLAGDSGFCTWKDSQTVTTVGASKKLRSSDVLLTQAASRSESSVSEPKPNVSCYSTGDPHYTYFDTRTGDFQARGDFTMWKTSGLRVDVRQDHYIGLPTTHVNYNRVSTNNAFSVSGDWMCGYTFEVYAGSDKMIVTKPGGAQQTFTGRANILAAIGSYNCDKLQNGLAGNVAEWKFDGKARLRFQVESYGINLWLDVTGDWYLDSDSGICTKRNGSTAPVECPQTMFSEGDCSPANRELNPPPTEPCSASVETEAEKVCAAGCPDVIPVEDCVFEACALGTVDAARDLLKACTLKKPVVGCGTAGKLKARRSKELSGHKKFLGGKTAKSACECSDACKKAGGLEWQYKTKGGRCKCFKDSKQVRVGSGFKKLLVGQFPGSKAKIVKE